MFTYDLERHIPRVKKSISAYIGNLGEKLALKYLIENGFEVISFSGCLTVSLGYLQRRLEFFLRQREVTEKPSDRTVVRDLEARDMSSCLNDFLMRLARVHTRGEYKIFPSSAESRYIFITNKSGQSTLVYSWNSVNPITPRKSRWLMDKSHYKRMIIDNKILVARRFSKKTKELARRVKNLALVEAEPNKRKAHLEGKINDQFLISLLLKALQIPEKKWREKITQTTARAHISHEKMLDYAKEESEKMVEFDKSVKQFFGQKWGNFLRFCEAWKEDPDVPSGKEFHLQDYLGTDLVSRSKDWGFDYVAKKDSQIYLVEVKTNKAQLRKYQRKMMMKAKEFGFIPMIVRPKVSISARMEDVTTETI